VWYKTDCHNKFATEIMNLRIKAIKEGNTSLEKYCKMVLNSSYGYEGLNEENFNKQKYCNYGEAMMMQSAPNFIVANQITDNLFLVTYRPYTYKCDTCIQGMFFTLDNAKYAYNAFIYDFLFKCLDTDRFHFIEGDTDSSYWAIAGDPNEGPSQGFKNIIKDKEFWDAHYHEWFPDESKGIEDMKKLGGVCKEKEGTNMISLAPKCYACETYTKDFGNKYIIEKSLPADNMVNVEICKIKGASRARNPQITYQSFKNNVETGEVQSGQNCGFISRPTAPGAFTRMMTKYVVNKDVITGVHTKMIVLKNNSCAPYITNLTANDYICY
jgi:hypothetical protein